MIRRLSRLVSSFRQDWRKLPVTAPTTSSRLRRAFFEPLEDRRLMAVEVDGHSGGVGEITDYQYPNWTVGTGADRLLVVAIAISPISSSGSFSSVSSVTFGGDALTELDSIFHFESGARIELWGRPMGAGGPVSGNISIDTSDDVVGIVHLLNLTGVDQVDPTYALSGTGVAIGQTSVSTTLSTAPGDLAYDMLLFRSDSFATYNSNPGQITYVQGGSGASPGTVNGGASLKFANSSTVTMGWEITANLPTTPGIYAAINFNQAPVPEITVTKTDVIEGPDGAGYVVYTVTRSKTDTDLSVDYSVVGQSAVEGEDFVAVTPGTLHFAAGGPASLEVLVEVKDDNIVEAPETLELVLSNPVGATLVDTGAVGTIVDDDQAIYTIEDAVANEADGTLTFYVTASNPVDVPVYISVDYSDGTASVDDLDLLPGVAYFPALSTDPVAVTVPLTDDSLSEGTESFSATISIHPNTYNNWDGQWLDAFDFAEGTIVDNDVDLEIAQTESMDPVIAGNGTDNVQYVITVTNTGLTDATNVVISDVLTRPAGVALVAASNSDGTVSLSASEVNWSLPSLPVGASATLTVFVEAGPGAEDGSIIESVASVVSASEVPVNTADDSASVSTTVQAWDFGDAPDSYGTLLASSGAYHRVDHNLVLGSSIDAEVNGQPNATATGDDASFPGDDEDGVVLAAALVPDVGATAVVTASAAGKLDAWIDFNGNGTFEASEAIATSVNVTAGANDINFIVPSDAVIGSTFARFRLSSAGGLSPTGEALDGEVEDYRVTIATSGPITGPVIDDPQNPGGNVLLINGSNLSDVIVVQPAPGLPGYVRVVFPGIILGPYALNSFDRIEIFALGGNDTVVVDATITKPATIHGGAGIDTISGGSGDDVIYGDGDTDTILGNAGNDIILGGDGIDYLYGGLGNDLLIGGLGTDWLYGESGDDLLIGGSTTHDANFANLLAIRSLWNSPGTFTSRTASTASLVNSSTVLSDGVADYILGGINRDWAVDYALLDYFLDYNLFDDKKN